MTVRTSAQSNQRGIETEDGGEGGFASTVTGLNRTSVGLKRTFQTPKFPSHPLAQSNQRGIETPPLIVEEGAEWMAQSNQRGIETRSYPIGLSQHSSGSIEPAWD